MREIKYRVWNTISKTMKPFSEIKGCGVFAIADGLNSDDFIILPLKNSILNQYTGLKDKNDVEIYEGDIMMAPYMKKKPCVVEYSKTLAKFTMSGKFNFTAIDSNLEVIGNIYENPELLN